MQLRNAVPGGAQDQAVRVCRPRARAPKWPPPPPTPTRQRQHRSHLRAPLLLAHEEGSDKHATIASGHTGQVGSGHASRSYARPPGWDAADRGFSAEKACLLELRLTTRMGLIRRWAPHIPIHKLHPKFAEISQLVRSRPKQDAQYADKLRLVSAKCGPGSANGSRAHSKCGYFG